MVTEQPYRNPSASQLRHAAITAESLLRIDSAQKRGLIDGGPEINVDRCEEIISQARAAAHSWTDDEIDAAILLILHPTGDR